MSERPLSHINGGTEMRVLVLWEDPREEAEAENLANVLVTLAPQLATAHVDKHGGVEIQHSAAVALPKVAVRAAHIGAAAAMSTPEHAEYVAALERAVFKVDEPQPKPPQLNTVLHGAKVFHEVRACAVARCNRREEFTGSSRADLASIFDRVGWVDEFCPAHRHLGRPSRLRGGSNVH